jgi:hypothetical protein
VSRLRPGRPSPTLEQSGATATTTSANPGNNLSNPELVARTPERGLRNACRRRHSRHKRTQSAAACAIKRRPADCRPTAKPLVCLFRLVASVLATQSMAAASTFVPADKGRRAARPCPGGRFEIVQLGTGDSGRLVKRARRRRPYASV